MELVRRGLATDREEARALVQAGRVTVDGGPAFKATTQVAGDEDVAVLPPPRRYVSRGGVKLEHAIEHFRVEVSGRRCLDAGASTGGFTDCLLQHGAAHVVACDVGYGQLHHRLRTDDRVTVLERTNVRELTPGRLAGPPPSLIVCDVAFIGLRAVLPPLQAVGADGAEAVVLVKPQFEAPREDVGSGGVVSDPGVWRRVLLRVADLAAEIGWARIDITPSPLLGASGNVEFLARLRQGRARAEPAATDDIEAAVTAAAAMVPEHGEAAGGSDPDGADGEETAT